MGKQTTDKATFITTSHGEWIEDGILYNQHTGGLILSAALDVTQRSVELLNQHNLKIAPVIVIFKDIDKTKFKLSLSDYSKIISSLSVVDRISEAWVVNAPEEVRRMIEPLSKAFLNNRMHFTDSLEEAKKQARLHVADSQSVLDKK